MADNSVFISYRRDTGYPWARLVWDELRQHSVNAFLDVESLREAGRFDQRILKQIAARPYFLAVIADGSLDRCASESDWVRREMEHAIDNGRIIVPLFIAPFEPSRFPENLPPRIREALANSSGVTFYSQFVPAALEQLISLIDPVDLSRVGLTDDDARFERGAQLRVESEQRPELPATQAIPVVPSNPDVEGGPAERSGSEPNVDGPPPGEAPPAAPPPPWYQTPTASPVVPPGPPPSVAHSELPDRSPPPPVPISGWRKLRADGFPSTKLIAIASAVVIALALGGIVALSMLGDDTGDEGAASTESAPGDSTEVMDSAADITSTVTDPPASTVPTVTRLATDDDNAYVRVGEPLVSENGRHELVMTASGQLELRTGGATVWAPEYFSAAVPGAVAVLQEDDGNFVVYSDEDVTEVLWTIGVLAGRDVVLEIHEDAGDERPGYVALFDRAGNEVWRQPNQSSGRSGRPDSESTTTATTPSDTAESGGSSTTAPSPAEITVGAAEVDSLQSIVTFPFKNSGGSSGSIAEIEMEVLRAFVSRAPSGQSEPLSSFDLGPFTSGDRCTFDAAQLPWADIPPTADGIEERSISFGGIALDVSGTDDAESFAWTMELRFSVTVAGASEPTSAGDVTVNVRNDPTGGGGPGVVPDCS